jgi:hypothetical protein
VKPLWCGGDPSSAVRPEGTAVSFDWAFPMTEMLGGGGRDDLLVAAWGLAGSRRSGLLFALLLWWLLRRQ